MNIPIVQGEAVAGPYSNDDPYGNKHPTSSSSYPPYYGNTTQEGGGDATMTFSQPQQQPQQQQPKQFNDVIWAVAFYAHLIAMITLCSLNIAGTDYDQIDGSFNGLVYVVGLCAFVAIGVSSAMLSVMMKYAEAFTKAALLFSVAMSGVVAVLGLLSGQMLMGILGCVMFAIGICYAKLVWPRIPFAAANLNTALTAVKANMGLTFCAYMMLFLAFGWSLLWFVGMGQAVSSSNAPILFLLLVSYFWVHQVLTNTIHVTTAGTIGTWWFVPEEADSCWSTAISDSFTRATTYSFGSICLGSLIVAIVQALRTMAHMARDNEDYQIIVCVIDCILGCIQDVLEYLNKWAYVYVGLYGFNYFEAGKNVIQLFQNKGWTVIITDDLADNVLFMVSVGVGMLTGLMGLAMAAADPNLLAALELGDNTKQGGFV